MSLWKIAWRSMQQRAVASGLTSFSIGLGVALVVAVLVIHAVIDQSFRRSAQGYDLIVGAKGDRLQLVLNTVFHLSDPTDNIPYSYYENLVHGGLSAAVETAVPVCTGHGYRGFAVIATTPGMFNNLTYLDNRKYTFAEGENFRSDDHYAAVLGATAARKTGLGLDDEFKPTGTVAGDSTDPGHEDSPFHVVGILNHTGTPNDRAIFINIEGFYACPAHAHGKSFAQRLLVSGGDESDNASAVDAESEHAEEHAGETGQHEHADAEEHEHADADEHAHEHEHEHEREVTAVLVCTDQSDVALQMAVSDAINDDTVAQAVQPAQIIAALFEGLVGNVQRLLLVLAVLVVIVAGIGILVSIYNSMSERRHEIAVMRALGAGRFTVMVIILTESILLSLGGGAIGLLLGHGLIGALSPMILEQTGVLVSPFAFQGVELILVPGLIVLATLVGFLPALSAYRTDVAKALIAAP